MILKLLEYSLIDDGKLIGNESETFPFTVRFLICICTLSQFAVIKDVAEAEPKDSQDSLLKLSSLQLKEKVNSWPGLTIKLWFSFSGKDRI